MSMLAERKRKQKWSLNPRGKDWAQDTTKFGHKMLEKMGWSQGKGLGANEDGLREHIKVSHKNDSTGIGYKESDDQWTEHESNFSALLEALGGGEQKNQEIKLNSLEEKSQNSRVRVHYKKFTRGKDLSKYSEKDLANIFGKKTLKELKTTKKVERQQVEQGVKEETDIEATKKSHLFSHGGLISDYFKKKFPSFGKTNGFVVGNNGVLQKADDSESENEARPSFGFGFKQESEKLETVEEEGNRTFVISKEESRVESNCVSFVYDNDAEDSSKRKKNKKRRNLDVHSIALEGTPTKKKKQEHCTDVEDTPPKKKKLEPSEVHVDTPIKKKRDKSINRLQKNPQSGLSNPAFDPLYTPIKLEKHILEPIEESLSESMLNDTVGEVAERFEVEVQINNDSTPVKMKSKHGREDDCVNRKKNKKDKTDDMDISYQNESLDQSIDRLKSKKSQKRKNIEQMDTSSSNMSVMDTDTSANTLSLKSDKKRKKNKSKSIESLDIALNDGHVQSAPSKGKKSQASLFQEGLDNPFFNMSIKNEESVLSQTDNPFEVKIKEKKKSKDENKSIRLENPVFNEEDSVNSQDVTNDAFELKRKEKSRKKKKSKDENENLGLENPMFNEDSVNSQDVTNEAFEIKRKEKSRKKKNSKDENENLGLENPMFNEEDSVNSQDVTNEAFELKRKEKSRKKKKSKDENESLGLENPMFNEEDSVNSQDVTNEAFELKRKEKSRKKKKSKDENESLGLENPMFNEEDSVNSQDVTNEAFKVKQKEKSKKKKKEGEATKGLDNPALNLNDTIDESCDLMLNVVATPPISKDKEKTKPLYDSLHVQKVSCLKRRKSVRFSDVTRERIIPSKDEIDQDDADDSTDIIEVEGKLNDSSELTYIDNFIPKKKAKKRKQGLDNTGFDKQATSMEENITSISNTLDAYQAEIENDMNEAKLKSVEIEDIMVGEVGNPDGTNEVLPDGSVKLKFKHAKFNKSARFIDGLTGAKKSYKHLIKGDIVMKFKESNLHEIDGYAVKAS